MVALLDSFSQHLSLKMRVRGPMHNGPLREPYFSQPDVHTRSATAPNYMMFGVLVLL